MRIALITFAIGLMLGPCMAGPRSRPEIQLRVSGSRHFQYAITHPELVRQAWIEVLDRPLLLDKKPIEPKASGEFDWEWDRTRIKPFDIREDLLTLSVWDPEAYTIACVDTEMSQQPGGLIFHVTMGGREEFDPSPWLDAFRFRVVQGHAALTLDLTGSDLVPGTAFEVHAQEGAECESRFVLSQVLDLAHARITLGRECLRKTGILSLSADNWDHGAEIHVVSANSPVLRSVSPSTISAEIRDDELALVLLGDGFNPQSKVEVAFTESGVFFDEKTLLMQTEYVSPAELRARIYPGNIHHEPLSASVYPRRRSLGTWVQNYEQFEVSESLDIELEPPPGQKPPRKMPLVTSVSPYPIQLMTEHSPEELKITIHGRDFVPENTVVADFGEKLRTQFVSPTLLQAWMPRQFWRKRRITYRLVVETTSGKRFRRQVDEIDDL